MNTSQMNIPLEAIAAGLGTLLLSLVVAYKRGKDRKARRLYVELETRVRGLLTTLGVVPHPSVAQLERADINDALTSAFGEHEELQIVHTDSSYTATDRGGVEQISEYDILQYAPYRPEIYDCEEFAQLFDVSAELVYGISAIGVCYDWGEGHAYNVAVLDDESVVCYEPQEATIVAPGETLTLSSAISSTDVTYDPGNALLVI
jgi:hypothetical protein